MDASLRRRLHVANCWATTRISVLDCYERYEDSYAITQEFREWITCIEENQEHLDSSVLMVPLITDQTISQWAKDKDEMLEI